MENKEDKKSQLEKVIKSSTEALQNQLGDYQAKGKNILIIGGIILAAFALSKVFGDDDIEEVETQKSKESSFLGSVITGMATSVLLALAKNKILEVIEQLNSNEEDIK
jgi:hypothetical protein